MKKMNVSDVGCCLVDRLYNQIVFQSEVFSGCLSRQKGDGGLTPGQLVFKEEFDKFTGRDLIFRVGQDRIRKLGPDDRFVGVIRLAQQHRMDYDRILEAMTYAFSFHAADEKGNRSEPDLLFDSYLEQGIAYTLEKVCGFNPIDDSELIETVFNEQNCSTFIG